jgi:hypothetical protein
VWSATQSFATVPSSVGTGKITVGVYGDARDSPDTWTLVNQRMQNAAPNLLLVSGDIVDIGTEESLFSQWLDGIWKASPDSGATGFITLGQFIMVPVAGNHENDSSQFYANFAIPGTGPYARQFSSFDVGNTHFLMIDDQSIGEYPTADATTATLAWVDADLKAAQADRAAHPFIVAINHRGLYSTSNHATDFDVINARGSLAPLFDKYHVDLVMNGHDHEYERTNPITAGTDPKGDPIVQSSTAKGTTYVINAGAGAAPYAVGSVPVAYRAVSVGLGSQGPKNYPGCYVLLDLEGTKLTMTAYGLKASGGSVAGDDVIDTLVLGQ